MENTNYINYLPLETLCNIFTSEISLHELLAIRETSQSLYQQVTFCIQSIVTTDNREGMLLPEIVQELPNLQVVSPNIRILVENNQDIIDLAEHPSLKEAVIDLSKYHRDFSNVVTLILLFFQRYPTLGKTKQDCQGRYNFTFVINPDELIFIQVTEGSLHLHNIGTNTFIDLGRAPLSNFYIGLRQYVPICEFIGDLHNHLGYLSYLPNLEKVSLRKRRDIYVDPENLIESIMVPTVKEYYLSIPKGQTGEVHSIITTLKRRNAKYPNVTTFFPIPIYQLDLIWRIFPNLTSIWIQLSSLNEYLHQALHPTFLDLLNKYPEIILVNNLEQPRDQNLYLGLFPPELHDRITFIESDWLD